MSDPFLKMASFQMTTFQRAGEGRTKLKWKPLPVTRSCEMNETFPALEQRVFHAGKNCENNEQGKKECRGNNAERGHGPNLRLGWIPSETRDFRVNVLQCRVRKSRHRQTVQVALPSSRRESVPVGAL
jgi:hypothetical protein